MIGQRTSTEIHDIQISALVDGAGDPVVFLHGWGGNAESFQPLWEQLRLLGAEGQFLALDLPGFGESAPLSSPWTLRQYVECVVKYLDHHSIDRCRFVVHSFGGRIMTLLTASYPEHVTSIMYIAPAGIRRHTFRSRCIRSIAHVIRRCRTLPLIRLVYPPLRCFVYHVLHTTEYVEASPVMQKTYEQVIAQDLTPYLSSLTVPVHIFWGTNDSYVPVRDGRYMHRVIPHAQLTLFRGARHGIHKTHAAEIAPIIIAQWNQV